MPIATINPATAETLQTFDALTDAQLDDKIAHAARTFQAYRRTPLAERAAWMLRAAEILEAEQDAFGRLMTTEMGKLVKAGREEAAKCAWGCRFYAEHAAAHARRRAGAEHGDRELRPLPAARPDPRGDAVELSVLAGLPPRGARADGRQRRAAQARVERAAVRARDRGHLPARGLSRRRVPDAADRPRTRSSASWTIRASPARR